MKDGMRIKEGISVGLRTVTRPTVSPIIEMPYSYTCHSCGKVSQVMSFWIVKGSEVETYHDCCEECASSGAGQTHGTVVRKEEK